MSHSTASQVMEKVPFITSVSRYYSNWKRKINDLYVNTGNQQKLPDTKTARLETKVDKLQRDVSFMYLRSDARGPSKGYLLPPSMVTDEARL